MSQSEKFNIRFEREEHHFGLKDFITTIQLIEEVIEEVNKNIFSNNYKFSLFILPPRRGSFEIVFEFLLEEFPKYYLSGQLLESIFKLLTGKKIADYTADKITPLKDAVVGLMTKETKEIDAKAYQKLNLDKAIRAKSDFYEMCIQNQSLKAVEFDNHRKISRNDYPRHITKQREKELGSKYGVHKAYIVSPVTINQNKRMWHFQDFADGGKISAYMADPKFLTEFEEGKHPLKETEEPDTIIMLVEYRYKKIDGEIKKGDRFVRKVYRINEKKVRNMPDDFVDHVAELSNDKDPFPLFRGLDTDNDHE